MRRKVKESCEWSSKRKDNHTLHSSDYDKARAVAGINYLQNQKAKAEERENLTKFIKPQNGH